MESGNDTDGPNFSTLSERRRGIFERIVARYAESGIVLDDPDYLHLIGLWVAGEIEMRDVTVRWNDILGLRYPNMETASDGKEIASDLEEIPKMSQAQLLAEIGKLSGD
jgi:hypothetical protein